QASTANVLPADRWSTSALSEVLSSLVSATCGAERERVCREDIGSAGRHSYRVFMNNNNCLNLHMNIIWTWYKYYIDLYKHYFVCVCRTMLIMVYCNAVWIVESLLRAEMGQYGI
ncbi:MAG: hypothetical protein J1E01_10875, partial [Acetatifactor sp.]|nr:hypothetical protein [Acetatifactor sp.]